MEFYDCKFYDCKRDVSSMNAFNLASIKVLSYR